LDEDTGLYYFGARYYDARTSVWASVDPILAKYLPTGDKEKDGKLPGMGGVFNTTNLNLYHYAGLNPVKLVDPDGNQQSYSYYQPMPPSYSQVQSYRNMEYEYNRVENYRENLGDAAEYTFGSPASSPEEFKATVRAMVYNVKQIAMYEKIASQFPKGTVIYGYIFYTPGEYANKDISFTAIYVPPKCETTCIGPKPVAPTVMMPSDMVRTGLLPIEGTGNSSNLNTKTTTLFPDGSTYKELNTKQLIEHGFLRFPDRSKIPVHKDD